MKLWEAIVEIVKIFVRSGCPGYALIALALILSAIGTGIAVAGHNAPDVVGIVRRISVGE